ncbi:hypothetical protein EV2_031783 [Malus domestica]
MGRVRVKDPGVGPIRTVTGWGWHHRLRFLGSTASQVELVLYGGYTSGLQGQPPLGHHPLGGPGSSLYGLPPSSDGIPYGRYPEGWHYGLSAYQNQHHQQAGTSPHPRVPQGEMYPNVPPYF